MELIGRVLWWSERDENGIIVDPSGNEFYFDRSVLKSKINSIQRNAVVYFRYNKETKDCLCACNVSVPSSTKQKSLEIKFNDQLRLSSMSGAENEQ